jgi:hypothetical protein
MAFQLQSQNDFENSGLYGGSVQDLNDIVFDRQSYTATYPGLRSFTSIYFVPFGGMTVGSPATSFVIDVTAQQIFMIRGGNMKIIAGMYGFTGYRDGTGSQALLGMGGFQEAYGYCVDSLGALYVTDTKNGKIRKLVEQGNGTWTVSTYATYSTTAIACDAADNIWTTSGSTLIKIFPGGATQTYQTGISNINQIAMLANGHILIVTRANAWDAIYDFNPANSLVIRRAGMTEAEVNNFFATNGFILVDGPAINGATYHSPQFAYWNADGTEIWMGGGDERQLRRYLASTGRVDSLFPDGAFYETQVRIGGSTNDNPSLPFYMVSPGGKQANGYPWDFGRSGAITAALKVVPVDIGDPALFNGASFISQTIPTTMVADQQYPVTVTMRNTGSTTWTPATDYRLGTQNPQDNTTWLNTNRVFMAAGTSAAPNTNYTFSFTVRAPTAAGNYNMQFKMVREAVEWFGALSANAVVAVAAPQSGALIPVTVQIRL